MADGMVKRTMSTAITFMFTAILCLCAFLVPEAVCAAPDGDSAPSDTSLNKAFEELFSAKTAKDSINAYNDIGWYLYNNNDFHKSVEMFRSALNISVAVEDKKNMAQLVLRAQQPGSNQQCVQGYRNYVHPAPFV